MSTLYLTILFPLIGFILLAVGRDKLSENVAAIIGVGSVGLSALFALIAGLAFTSSGQPFFVQHLWTWFNVGGFAPGITLYLDGLSLLISAELRPELCRYRWFVITDDRHDYGCGFPHPYLCFMVYARRRRLCAFLLIFQPVCCQHVGVGAWR